MEIKNCLSQLPEPDGLQPQENVILRDWFSFTSKKHSPEELIAAMGLSHCNWTPAQKGAHGYQDRLFYGSISVHFNGREDMGVWVEMTGQGCRSFEDVTTLSNKWDDLIAFVLSNNLHVTRFDVAFDDHTGVLDMDRVQTDVENLSFVSHSRWWETVRSSQGQSAYIGSPKSPVRIRIYDKARERGFDDGRHWVRVEMQLRDERADKFLRLCMSQFNGPEHLPGTFTASGECAENLSLGQAFSGVVLNYLRIVEPCGNDSNKSRWKMADYWSDFLEKVGAISIFTAPGGAYNEARCKNYVFNLAGNAVSCMVDLLGVDDFLTALNARTCKPNPKYDVILYEHHVRLEAWRNRVSAFLDLQEDLEYACVEREGRLLCDGAPWDLDSEGGSFYVDI